jgi:acyl-coenzyme A synthetase/AMP-(fatty) acid ligase
MIAAIICMDKVPEELSKEVHLFSDAEVLSSETAQTPATFRPIVTPPDELVAIIYTSGSTGVKINCSHSRS